MISKHEHKTESKKDKLVCVPDINLWDDQKDISDNIQNNDRDTSLGSIDGDSINDGSLNNLTDFESAADK